MAAGAGAANANAKKPLRVLLTGAAGQIGYALIPHLVNGTVFGASQPVILHLLDIKMQEKVLKGVVMEIEDCAYPLLAGVVATSDVKEAFTGVDVACLVGGFPRLKGMERSDLLAKNAAIFVEQGRALRQFASPNVKVLVVANPANSNCLVAVQNACLDAAGPGKPLPTANFTCLTRLDQNRARHQLAARLGQHAHAIKNVIIWGNHSSTLFPDHAHAHVATAGAANTPLAALTDAKEKLSAEWVDGFVKTVQQRGAAVIEARGLSSAVSAANAIADHLRDWLNGTVEGEFVSMGVYTEGKEYGVGKGLVYSLPLKTKAGGEWEVIKGLVQSDFAKKWCQTTEKELEEEAKLLPKAAPANTTA